MPPLTDISSVLTLLLGISGLIWILDAALLRARRRGAAHGAAVKQPLLVKYARSFTPVLVIVLLVRCFVFEPFRIPSASMMPGLKDGDFIFVNKYRYGLRLPLVNTKIMPTGNPERGDVIVFRLPSDPAIHFIKRLIGLPGDHIVVKDNHVFINGAQIGQRPGGLYQGGDGFSGSDLAIETLGDKHHLIMLAPDRPATDFDAVVPDSHYFFMGDNRNDSADGRFALVGFVPEENLLGPATRIGLNYRLNHWANWRRAWMPIS